VAASAPDPFAAGAAAACATATIIFEKTTFQLFHFLSF
jgi:hypothetical protein